MRERERERMVKEKKRGWIERIERERKIEK